MSKRTALIIGASRGLGLGLAAELAARGWQVVATARDAGSAKLQALAARTQGAVEVETVDVDRDDTIAALASRVAARRFDLLFVNAGISTPGGKSVQDTDRDALAQVLWTNAIGPLRIAQQLAPRVVDGGTVAFMSSILGSIGENTSGGHDLYRVSKVALNMLARSFAVTSAAQRRQAVLSLHPGWVRTDMGGPQAPVGIEDSVRGLADVLEAKQQPGHRFVEYTGRQIAW